MKKIYFIVIIAAGLTLPLAIFSCKRSFLDKSPIGSVDESLLADKSGVNSLLIGAYSILDGWPAPVDVRIWNCAVSNWVFDTGGDDAYKGSNFGDEAFIEEIENYSVSPVNVSLNDKWRVLYHAVQRSNDVLRLLAKVPAGKLTDAEALQIKAEALFLRAVYHFEAAKLWRNVPYIDETVTYEAGNYNVPNTAPIWPKIEADFLFAATNLTPTKTEVGRANSWAAKAFLAKVYMFQHRYSDAKPLLDNLIASGMNAGGIKYALDTYFRDNFDALKKNSSESVFAVQMTVNDGSTGFNSNYGNILNFAWGGGPSRCCGFYQPSQNLVNAFQTDANGLPLFGTYNDNTVKNDLGLPSTAAFTPYTGTLDPRLDWTVGRRGIPYLDWGIMQGSAWIRNQLSGGPYEPLKNVTPKSQDGATNEAAGGWQAGAGNAINYEMIRFADVLLWAAEVEVEIGSLAKAEEYVNMIRSRAADPVTWVHTYVDNNDPSKGFTNSPAANYQIGLYNGRFETQGQDYAKEAVRFERRLELAMEGHRFFDLQRYDNGTGYMASILNEKIRYETSFFNSVQVDGKPLHYVILEGHTFTKGKNEILPIPQAQIDLSTINGVPTLKQN